MDESTTWDIIVVGGGPAGSTVARHLAREGKRVLLLEKDKQVGRKACGGGLTDRAVRLLDLPVATVAQDECEAVRVAVGKHRGRYHYDHTLMTTVHRREFDAWLLQAARDAGAAVQQGQTVRRWQRDGAQWTVTTATGTHGAPYLVAADGVRSRIARSLGLATPAAEQAFALAQDLQADEATTAHWAKTAHLDFSLGHGGFGWVFPKGRVLAVGLGVPQPYAPRIVRQLRDYLRREGLGDLPALGPVRGAFIPRGTALPAYQREGCLLVGDAAGLADALTGEGICAAMHSGQLAARALAQALDGRAGALTGYEAAVRAELLPELRAAREVADLVFGPWARPWRKLLTTDRALRVMAALTTGQRSYESVREAIIERTPFGVGHRLWRRMRRS